MNTYTQTHLLRRDAALADARSWKAAFAANCSEFCSITLADKYRYHINSALLKAGEHEFQAYLSAGGIR